VFDKIKKISKKDLEICAQAGRLAPSACNSQPWKFIIIDSPENMASIRETVLTGIYNMNSFAENASAFIAVCAVKSKLPAWLGSKLKRTDYRSIDIGGACEYLVLQAEELGIASCILGWFNEKKLKKILKVPYGIKIELLVALGYPLKPQYPEKIRKDSSEVISFNKY
jgi:nitroreductase